MKAILIAVVTALSVSCGGVVETPEGAPAEDDETATGDEAAPERGQTDEVTGIDALALSWGGAGNAHVVVSSEARLTCEQPGTPYVGGEPMCGLWHIGVELPPELQRVGTVDIKASEPYFVNASFIVRRSAAGGCEHTQISGLAGMMDIESVDRERIVGRLYDLYEPGLPSEVSFSAVVCPPAR